MDYIVNIDSIYSIYGMYTPVSGSHSSHTNRIVYFGFCIIFE